MEMSTGEKRNKKRSDEARENTCKNQREAGGKAKMEGIEMKEVQVLRNVDSTVQSVGDEDKGRRRECSQDGVGVEECLWTVCDRKVTVSVKVYQSLYDVIGSENDLVTQLFSKTTFCQQSKRGKLGIATHKPLLIKRKVIAYV